MVVPTVVNPNCLSKGVHLLRRLENVKNDDFAPFRKNFIVTMVRDKENAFKHEI